VPKHRILELYLNVIELGPDVHGVEAAAQYWFGKAAGELDVREAVHLAALAPAPRRFAKRFASGEVDEAWDEMLDRQVRRMHLAGHITASERDRGLRSRLRLVPHP
jgi:membrane peptidoglycan carboxypeptidase